MTELHIAECHIRQLHARYCDAVWRQDIDAFVDCFAEDCEWRIAGHVVTGREQVRGFMSSVFPLFRRILLTKRTPIIEVTGEAEATARTYFTENSVKADGVPLFAIGTYYERCIDEGDRWRFAWRAFFTEYAGPVDQTGPFFDNPDYGPPPAMPPAEVLPPDHSGNLTDI
jgi:uncharacterized protein (TIGR02246 family)